MSHPSNWKYTLPSILLLWALSLGLNATTHPVLDGSRVGGRVLRTSAIGLVPASGMAVQLVNMANDSSATIYTDSEGWYIFEDVPRGVYHLLIHVNPQSRLQTNLLTFPASGEVRIGDITIPDT